MIEDCGRRDPFCPGKDGSRSQIDDHAENRCRNPAVGLDQALERAVGQLGRKAEWQRAQKTTNSCCADRQRDPNHIVA